MDFPIPHAGNVQHTVSDKVATANGCCCQSAAFARGQNGARRVVLAEPVGPVDGEQLREPRAGTIDPALDRPYRAFADRSRLIVEKPDAPTRSRASRWPDGSFASATRNSSNSTRLGCCGGDFRLST